MRKIFIGGEMGILILFSTFPVLATEGVAQNTQPTFDLLDFVSKILLAIGVLGAIALIIIYFKKR